MSYAPNKTGGTPHRERGVTLHLRVPTVIGGLLALLVGLIWVFILGILVGRGQAPEEQIPQIAGLMPKVEASAIPPPQLAEPQPNTVIPEEDLSYPQVLRPETAGRPGPPTPQKPGTTAAPDTPKPGTTPAQPQPPAVAETPKETFDYVYQVAAYKSAEPCDKLLEKLKKSGLKASVEKSADKSGATWYKALVSVRGGPDEVKALQTALGAHKLSAPMLRSKKPVKR